VNEVFFRRRGQRDSIKSTVSQYRTPGGVRVYAIGDVHGCLTPLKRLLHAVEKHAHGTNLQTHLVFLGDLVDRGPHSSGVLGLLMSNQLPCDSHHFLMGNHEEAMLAVWNGDTGTTANWLRYGGRETLLSYGASHADIFAAGADLPRLMRAVIPEAHIRFIERFQNSLRVGDYLFVHAGIRPGVPIAEQEVGDLRWIRNEFLSDDETDHGVMVVHGHTISSSPDVRTNRIGIDTGCYSSGVLTALVLEESRREFLQTQPNACE
jgi:serine/threonine protein phosphatase 1